MRIWKQRKEQVPALLFIVSMSPPGIPRHGCVPTDPLRFARQDYCSSAVSIGRNFRMRRQQEFSLANFGRERNCLFWPSDRLKYYDSMKDSHFMAVFRKVQSLTIVLLLCCHSVFAQQGWEARAEANAQRLIAKNGTGRDLELKRELLKMRDDDQGIRNRLNAAPEAQKPAVTKEMESTDVRLTDQLKGIVAQKGWPTISLVGAEASQAAATILVHSPEHDWQRRMLPLLQKLVEQDKIFGSDIAGLRDRILVSEGEPQEFGTQFKQVDGKMVMMPVKDLKHLEQRRAKYLLPPMPVYRQLISDMYHLPAE